MDPTAQTPITPSETLTATVALWNAATAFLTVFLVLLVYGYKRNPANFDFITWALENKNRFIVGAIMIIAFTSLTVLTPDLSALFQVLGFNIEAKIPLSLGLGLAAFLIGGLNKNNLS